MHSLNIANKSKLYLYNKIAIAITKIQSITVYYKQ